MAHLEREALARFLSQTGTTVEREGVAWHLEHCPACKKELTAREIMEIAKAARTQSLTRAARAALFRSHFTRNPVVAHLRREALARFLSQTGTTAERESVAWHLEHCPVCKKELTACEITEVVEETTTKLVSAARASK